MLLPNIFKNIKKFSEYKKYEKSYSSLSNYNICPYNWVLNKSCLLNQVSKVSILYVSTKCLAK